MHGVGGCVAIMLTGRIVSGQIRGRGDGQPIVPSEEMIATVMRFLCARKKKKSR